MQLEPGSSAMALRHVSAGRVAVPRALFAENLRRINRAQAEATADMTMEPSTPASLQQTCIRPLRHALRRLASRLICQPPVGRSRSGSIMGPMVSPMLLMVVVGAGSVG
jgi:hypothetical protein